MTFAHYDFSCAASIHKRSHQQEEVYEVIEGVRLAMKGRSDV